MGPQRPLVNGIFGLIYCPYTDCDIPEEQTTSEHIIPLSLGGTNGLEIPVDMTVNSAFGNELDGALANEFFMTLRRSEYGACGHSGKEPWAITKNASYGKQNRRAQVHLHREFGIRLWDIRDREEKAGAETITFKTFLDLDLPIRFAAKVALAAGYFVYGDLFRREVDHQQLREVIRLGFSKFDRPGTVNDHSFDHITLQADHYLKSLPPESSSKLSYLRRFCSAVKGSVIVLFPSQCSLGVAVGILGQYLAMVDVPANTKIFPNEDDYAWGHVLAVIDGQLKRCSWVNGLKLWTTTPNTK